MVDKYTSGVKVHALLNMVMPSLGEPNRIVRQGLGMDVYLSGKLYVGRVVECEVPLSGGDSGEAVIDIISSEAWPIEMAVGTQFELRAGPRIVVATAVAKKLIA